MPELQQISNLTVCYEAIQRVYRNAVVRHLRKTLTECFPEDWRDRLRKPFEADEWRRIESNCYGPRVSGQLGTPVIDDYDLLSVNHFFNLFDAYYEKLFPVPEHVDKVQKRSDKKRVLEWSRTVKELRDPTAHPTEEDFGYEDSFVLMDCARRILIQLALHAEAREVQKLMGGLTGQVHVIGEPLEASLPASETIVSDFVGREQELRTLWDWVCNPTTRRWALAGAGGKGKTAIAYQLAQQVRGRAPEPLQAVLWLSAKKRRFSEGQIVSAPVPDFEDLDSALNQVLFQYGWIEEITNTLELKRTRAIQLFNEFPSLLVVDDIDSIDRTDEDAIEFFTFSVPQTKSKVLMTSRRTIFGMANATTPIEGFSESDVGRFISSRCQMFGLDRQMFTSQLVKSIRSITEASPLYIEDLMRLITIMPPADAVRAWSGQEGQTARQYALGRELDMQSREARHVLIAACFYDTAVSFPELRAITGYSDVCLSDSLAQLQGLFLVPKPRLIEGESRFEINVNVKALVREVEGKSELFRSVQAAYRAVSGTLPRVGRGDIAGFIRQAVLLVKNDEEEQAQALLTRALEVYPNDGKNILAESVPTGVFSGGRGMIRQFARLLRSGGRPKALCMLAAYCDESGKHKEASRFVIAGLRAKVNTWAKFSRKWSEALKTAGVSCFHASECENGYGEFETMLRAERQELQRTLIRIISSFDFVGIGDLDPMGPSPARRGPS